jgi:tRNA nucleotidyltransferase/poly(A) polymerase
MFNDPESDAHMAIITLENAGFKAHAIGGCVRDLILGRKPKDYDLVTNATPEEIIKLFPKTVNVGAAFGVIVAVLEHSQVEIATYRADGVYSDGRRPDTVIYAKTLEEDVRRRDFTMNGIAASALGNGVHMDSWTKDYVHGYKDIEAKIIRTIGDPVERFTEDPLRMLRAIRFSAQLGFTIEKKTFAAIQKCAKLIQKVSAERVRTELISLLTSDEPGIGIANLLRSGLLNYRMQWLLDLKFPRLITLLELVKHSEQDRYPSGFMLGVFLESLKPAMLGVAIKDLKLSYGEEACIKKMWDWPMLQDLRYAAAPWRPRVKRAMREPYFAQAMRLFELDQLSGIGLNPEPFQEVNDLVTICKQEGIYPAAFVDGDDLMEYGYEGKAIGDALYLLESAQLDGAIDSKDQALRYIGAIK